jgi:hypothetical protein
LSERIRRSPNRRDNIQPAPHHAWPQLPDSVLAAVCLHTLLPKYLKNWSYVSSFNQSEQKKIESQSPSNL